MFGKMSGSDEKKFFFIYLQKIIFGYEYHVPIMRISAFPKHNSSRTALATSMAFRKMNKK